MNRLIKSLAFKACLLILFTSITSASLAKTLSNYNFFTFAVTQDNQQIISIQSTNDDVTKELHVTDLATGELVKKIKLPLFTNFSWFKPNLVITPDGKKVYVVDIDKKLYLIDIPSGTVEKIKNKPKQDIGKETSSAMALSADGKFLYIADGVSQLHTPPVIHILNTTTNKIIATVEGEKGWWGGFSALDTALSLLYISRQVDYYNGEISIFDTRTQRLDKAIININDYIASVAINPLNGQLYVTGNNTVYVIDPNSRQIIDEIHDYGSKYISFAFALQSKKFFVLNEDGCLDEGVVVFNTVTKEKKLIPLHPLHSDSEMKASFDGSKIYVNHEHTIYIIDANNDVIIRVIEIK